MKVQDFKGFIKPLSLMGIDINKLIPTVSSAIKAYSEKIQRKAFFMFDQREGALHISIYAENEDGKLDGLHSYEIPDIETIFSIIESIKNEDRIQPAAIGNTENGNTAAISGADNTDVK